MSAERRRQPTITDVAEKAGVSKGAVSLALGGRPGVGDATRERVRRVAAELGWSPSIQARGLLASRAFSLGLVIAQPPRRIAADPFFPAFVSGIETVLVAAGYTLVLQMIGDGPRVAEESYRRLFQERRVDGVFLTDLERDDRRLPLVADLGLAAVAVGPPTDEYPTPLLGSDDRVGIEAAVQHLHELGHRRIGFVGGPKRYVHSIARRQGWSRALRALGLAPGPSATGDFTGEGGERATHRLLARDDPPTAIVFASDLMAVAGISAARASGYRVPEDLSVTGFDNMPMAAHVGPPLTSVDQDAIEWGRVAARTLLDVIDDKPYCPPALPPPTLVVRQSTAPARSAA